MYLQWEKNTQKRFNKYGYQLSEGFSGSAIAMTVKGLEKAGLWDERIQGADFDLYARTKQRHEEVGDIQPLSIISGLYIHHYGRMTTKSKYKPVPFADSQNMISFKDKWGNEKYKEIEYLLNQ
jgi:hypothetical protein